MLADLQAAAGYEDEALASIAKGLGECATTGVRGEVANLLTLRGKLLSIHDPAIAEGFATGELRPFKVSLLRGA